MARGERIRKARYNQQMAQISATEMALMRVLQASFGDKPPDRLPTWDEIDWDEVQERVAEQSEEDAIPAWWLQYEAANPGRVKLGIKKKEDGDT